MANIDCKACWLCLFVCLSIRAFSQKLWGRNFPGSNAGNIGVNLKKEGGDKSLGGGGACWADMVILWNSIKHFQIQWFIMIEKFKIYE